MKEQNFKSLPAKLQNKDGILLLDQFDGLKQVNDNSFEIAGVFLENNFESISSIPTSESFNLTLDKDGCTELINFHNSFYK